MPRALALCGSVLLLALAGKLLLGPVRTTLSMALPEERIRLVFSVRAPEAAPPESPDAPRATGQRRPGVPRMDRAAPAPAPPSVPSGTRAAVQPPRVQLYGDDGRPYVPAETRDQWIRPPTAVPGLPRAPTQAAVDPLHRPTPVQPRTTRFAKDWISDGDIADVTAQEIMRAQRKIAKFLLGKDIEHARARPSPEVRFNPARHERAGDLGSEATGDAYKAAPIDYEPAPGLDGEASRRIREQVAALETAYARCDRTRLRALMQPLLLHLDELQKAEAAFARGADPVRAEHMLPNAANAAWDLARRALWHADARMAGCAAR
ncbi:hypothetical protein [Pseudoxanthomonas koreensis]|uniref:hypothetical protein n=1 Tax=Pseudoxanthomonas koreensis TaxID=266061 RepID=UPI001EE3D84F|nr:hypothetical protein [Pseudoxanthomonas koreensis]